MAGSRDELETENFPGEANWNVHKEKNVGTKRNTVLKTRSKKNLIKL